jgi:hypothetical protein
MRHKSHSEAANVASERAERAEKPGGPFTVKQAISKALHEKAARLHHKAKQMLAVSAESASEIDEPDADSAEPTDHAAKHQEHFEILKQFNWR